MDSDTENSEDCRGDSIDYKKMKNTLAASGYREGVGAGKDASFQLGFDEGFMEGFKTGFALGSHNGIIDTLKESPLVAPNLALLEGKAFPQARRGLCQLCINTPSESILNARRNQNQITRTSLEECQLYVSEVVNSIGLSSITEFLNISSSM